MKRIANNSLSRVIRLSIATFVFVCTVEALYWPLIMKPGIQLSWWQNHWLANTGFWVGLPSCALVMLWNPFSGVFSDMFGCLSAAAWAFIIFWIAGKLPLLRPKKHCIHVSSKSTNVA